MLGQQSSNNGRKNPSRATVMCVKGAFICLLLPGTQRFNIGFYTIYYLIFFVFLRRHSWSSGALAAAGRVVHVCARGGGVDGMEEEEEKKVKRIAFLKKTSNSF